MPGQGQPLALVPPGFVASPPPEFAGAVASGMAPGQETEGSRGRWPVGGCHQHQRNVFSVSPGGLSLLLKTKGFWRLIFLKEGSRL